MRYAIASGLDNAGVALCISTFHGIRARVRARSHTFANYTCMRMQNTICNAETSSSQRGDKSSYARATRIERARARARSRFSISIEGAATPTRGVSPLCVRALFPRRGIVQVSRARAVRYRRDDGSYKSSRETWRARITLTRETSK